MLLQYTSELGLLCNDMRDGRGGHFREPQKISQELTMQKGEVCGGTPHRPNYE